MVPSPENDKVRVLLSRQTAYSEGLAPEITSETVQLPASHYLWILRQQRWKISAFVAACVLVTYILCCRITPVYEAITTIEMDRQIPSGVVGQEASQVSLNDADQFLATQIKIIQSDSVLRPVVTDVANLRGTVARTDGNSEAPIVLKGLRVTRPPNTYLVQISYRSSDPSQAAGVANAIANSYIDYTYDGRIKTSIRVASFMERQLDELRAKMERSSAALTKFERELNVINPEEKTTILSARLMQLNTAYTEAQADRARKQSAAGSHGAGIEAAQVSQQGDGLKVLSERLNEAEQKFAEAKAHFGSNHPEYRKHAAEIAELQRQIESTSNNVMRRIDIEYSQAMKREEILKGAVTTTKAEFDKVNTRSFEYRALKEEAEANRKLYDELVRRIKEAGINANFHSNAIRVADLARPADKPVSPNIPLASLLSFLSSTLVAFAVAIIGDGMNSKVRDQVHLAKLLNTDVIGALPIMRQASMTPLLPSATAPGLPALSSSKSSEEAKRYHEAVCVLRSTIALSDVDQRVRSMLITSAMPGEGKTTTALQLAIANAQQERKTLLIDADLRRPSVHGRLGISGSVGLADYLSGSTPWRELVEDVAGVPSLKVMPAGRASRVIHEMTLHAFPKLLDEATAEYDLVIVDAAPLPGFAEPLEIARAVDGVVVMARAGKTDRRAVMTVLRTLERLHANVLGVVLNEVRFENQVCYYGYGYGNTSGNAA